jgi:hypothetical protein
LATCTLAASHARRSFLAKLLRDNLDKDAPHLDSRGIKPIAWQEKINLTEIGDNTIEARRTRGLERPPAVPSRCKLRPASQALGWLKPAVRVDRQE